MRCLLKLWQDVACALSQKQTPQAPRCTVGYEAVAEPISVWATAEKKKHFLLFCVALRLYRVICYAQVIIGCDRKTWGTACDTAIYRWIECYTSLLSCRAVANVVIKWFDVEFNFFSPWKTTKKGIHNAFFFHNATYLNETVQNIVGRDLLYKSGFDWIEVNYRCCDIIGCNG